MSWYEAAGAAGAVVVPVAFFMIAGARKNGALEEKILEARKLVDKLTDQNVSQARELERHDSQLKAAEDEINRVREKQHQMVSLVTSLQLDGRSQLERGESMQREIHEVKTAINQLNESVQEALKQLAKRSNTPMPGR